jgi:hypothetical protein
MLKHVVTISIVTMIAACSGSNSNEGNVSEETLKVEDVSLIILSRPEAISKSPYAEFQFSASSDVAFQCQLDQEDYVDCTSPHRVYPVAVGPHKMSLRAVSGEQVVGNAVDINWTVSSIFGDHYDTQAHQDLVVTQVQPDRVVDNSWRGILRINCDFAHSSYDDPIVYPGQDNAAHLHRFYGNTLVDEMTDTWSLLSTGDSSCQGNTLNRSSYWVPSLLAPDYDPISGAPVMNESGELQWKVVPAVVGNDEEAHEIFYYSAAVSDLESIQTIPPGLKMIAGNHMGQPGMEQDSSIVRWHCQSWDSSDATNPRWSSAIPECVAPDRVRMDIFFPSCWNGVDLDSDNHKSHMAYPINSNGPDGMVCPETHPVPIIRVSFHYAFGVKPEVYDPASKSSRGWRLASDMYEVSTLAPGGMSLHGDWFNAWHPEALQAILDNCIKNELDCHDGNLANGFRLTGTRAGTQDEAEVINQGLGN